jgi:uncharacterized radical SAM superfamily Fe-S cluster-containing enzyme
MGKQGNVVVLLQETASLCPYCLRRIPARIEEINGQIYMRKKCPEHGAFQVIIWRDNKEHYRQWLEYGGGVAFTRSGSGQGLDSGSGCPYDCGPCAGHRQEICSAAIMVTSRCNLGCPLCFTRNPGDPPHEPDLNSIKSMYEFYLHSCGEPYPVELCGGEPTVRDDLPEIIALGKEMGFDYIQLNTNGIRIARDFQYLQKLKESGLTTVYLGLDGVTEEPYLFSSGQYAGQSLLNLKLQAIENCAGAKLAVILVPCVAPGVNDRQLGDMIRLAREWMPAVKGVHFQPISYFGKYPVQPQDQDRITIPELLRGIEEQTGGEIRRDSFLPAGCEHPLCSFHGFFMLGRNGKLQALTSYRKREGTENEAAGKTRRFTKTYWRYSDMKTLTIGGMAFQDVWNIDLERLKRCIIHIICADQKLVPLCAKYLTGCNGEKIYPGIA